ncbi:ATP-binding protein [Streptomyces sp. NPDC060188]|uniref:ATP-binding protein n=1 Tax=Streptomyces sp. NPDC060188 TaxID=3347068 RepID=UPI00364BFEB7
MCTADAKRGDEAQPDTAPAAAGAVETTVALEDAGQSIADARHLAIAFLDRARTEHLVAVSLKAVELAQLVVSELVTNARKYAPGPVVLRLRIIAATVEISVWDSQPDLPLARVADPSRVGQHGLEIVTAIAQKVEIRREGAGKRITARLLLDDAPDTSPDPCVA